MLQITIGRVRRSEKPEYTTSAPDHRVFEAQLAEYLTARDEMGSAITNQHYVLTFGVAAAVTAFTAGFLLNPQGLFPAAMFYAIPALTSWVLIVWTGEVARRLPSVDFCTEQAEVINRTLGTAGPRSAMRWERWRRDPTHPERTLTWTYRATITFWLLLTIAALACAGQDLLHRRHWPVGSVSIAIAVWFVVGIPLATFVVARVFRPWRRARLAVGFGSTATGPDQWPAEGRAEGEVAEGSPFGPA